MKTLTFKVSDDEARLIRSLARREKLTVSEYLRRRASGARGAVGVPARVRCEFTGAMIFAPLPEQPPLDTASVREMLADFP
jgi:hypothetical protein